MANGRILLVGRGISGAVLSLRLMEKNIPHDIADDPSLSGSSRVAAGLLNPVVLKRLKLVAGAQEFLSEAPGFYQDWETKTGRKFYYPTPLHHVFSSIGEVNDWQEKSTHPLFDRLLGEVFHAENVMLPAPFGIGVLHGCSWLDTNEFLAMHLAQFRNYGRLIEHKLDPETLAAHSKEYEKVVLCNGHLVRDFLPDPEVMSPTRGEVMTIKTEYIGEEAIRHGNIFILPLGNNRFKVGATYHWDDLRDQTSEDGLAQLKTGLEKLYNGPYEVIEHLAGVRPNVKDRKPLMGQIADNGYHIFNGMGSRAVLMTPYLSTLMVKYLLDGEPLPEVYSIERFANK